MYSLFEVIADVDDHLAAENRVCLGVSHSHDAVDEGEGQPRAAPMVEIRPGRDGSVELCCERKQLSRINVTLWAATNALERRSCVYLRCISQAGRG